MDKRNHHGIRKCLELNKYQNMTCKPYGNEPKPCLMGNLQFFKPLFYCKDIKGKKKSPKHCVKKLKNTWKLNVP